MLESRDRLPQHLALKHSPGKGEYASDCREKIHQKMYINPKYAIHFKQANHKNMPSMESSD
jgi:hypothetical protein